MRNAHYYNLKKQNKKKLVFQFDMSNLYKCRSENPCRASQLETVRMRSAEMGNKQQGHC